MNTVDRLSPMLRFQRPLLPSTEEIDRYLDLSREERWFSNGGPCWRLLRDRLSDRVGAYCVPVASGTLGLMAAVAAAIESGRPGQMKGAALMPSFTFLATAQAAVWAGLTPRLLDVHHDHWHLDPARLEAALEQDNRVAAVLTVSAFGTPPPAPVRQRWEQACREAGVPLIVDSAAGFGAIAEDGVPIGAQGDIEVVSFHATKPFAIGEGGAVFTRSKALLERIESSINFGLAPDRTVSTLRGINGKMSELHAATALAVLDQLDSILKQRRAAAASIRAQAVSGVSWQQRCELSTFQFVPLALPDEACRNRMVELCEDRVEVRIYYEPLDALFPNRWQAVGELSTTHDLHRRMLCLPMANDLSATEVAEIASMLSRAETVNF